MSEQETTVYLGVPVYANLSQFTDVQRGIIFMWFLMALVITVITGIRVVSGYFDLGRSHDAGGNPQQPVPSPSMENFQHNVLRSQVVT